MRKKTPFPRTHSLDNGETPSQNESRPFYCRPSAIIGIIIFMGILGILTFLIGGISSASVQFFITTILSFLVLIVIAFQAEIYQRQWEVMRDQFNKLSDQENRMIEQRDIMERQANNATAQAGLMREGLIETQNLIKQNDQMIAALERQAELFSRQIDLMVRNECAYISIGGWKIPEPENNELIILGKFFNGGRTPALNFKRQFQVVTGEGTPPADWSVEEWDCKTQDAPSSMIVAGGETNFRTDPTEITPETLDDLRSGKQVVLLDGECIYADNSENRWIYKFGYTLIAYPAITIERYQTHEKYSGD